MQFVINNLHNIYVINIYFIFLIYLIPEEQNTISKAYNQLMLMNVVIHRTPFYSGK